MTSGTPPSDLPVLLNHHVWNPDGDRQVLLVHGLGSDGTTLWRLAAAAAATGARVVAPDLRGHGGSPATDRYTLSGYAADVARLGRGWDLVVGHSFGGAILADLLCDEGFARRAILVDPLLDLDDPTDLHAGLLAEVGGRLTIAAVLDAHPRWDREDVQRKVIASARVTDRVIDQTIRDNTPLDLTDRPARWRCPAHVLVAGIEPLVGARALAALAAHQVTIVGGTGHSIHRDEPEIVVAALRDALG
jgi:pimeloyl-ACP methyl ester carboxylesterase